MTPAAGRRKRTGGARGCSGGIIVVMRLAVSFPLFLAACVIGDPGDPSGESGAVEGGTVIGDDTSAACFEAPQCDPLAPECTDGKCVASDAAFTCAPAMPGQEELGLDQACSGALSCQEGLVCLPGGGSCTGDVGCCVALCDLMQPQCSGDTTCTPYLSDPSPCYEDVGVCVLG